jgi:hypothetical protein
VNVSNIAPDVLIRAVDLTAQAVLPPRGPDVPGAARPAATRELAVRLYDVPGDTWRAALSEWPTTAFFTSAVVRRLLEAEAPAVAAELRRGLVDPASSESWIYRGVKDAAFPAAFALGYAHGKAAAAAGE